MRKILAAILLMVVAGAAPVNAEGLYVLGGIGQSRFQTTTEDGTWRQDGMGTKIHGDDFAWKVGVGYRWDHWSLEVAYLNFGKTDITGNWTSDQNYDGQAHKCISACTVVVPNVHVSDRMSGIELVPAYHVQMGPVEPYLGVGVFGAHHTLNVYGLGDVFAGHVIGPAVRGGVCWQSLCAEATYYKGLFSTSQSYPISNTVLMPMLTYRLAF